MEITYIDFAQAREITPGRPDISTIWRWALRGYRGVHLRYVRAGRRVFTTAEWLEVFLRECAAIGPASTSPSPRQPRRRSPGRRDQQIAVAEARLAGSGFAQ